MVYESGTTSSSFDLHEKFVNFMTTVPGWQLWSNIDGYDGHNMVYYSTGSDGYKDIYFRAVSGLSEAPLIGTYQRDYGGGDTGYMNLFGYGYFPQGGDAYSGYTEVGTMGPRIFAFTGNFMSGSHYLQTWYQNVLSQQHYGTAASAGGTATSYSIVTPSSNTYYRKKWGQFYACPFRNAYADDCITWDGKKYFYYSYQYFNRIERYTTERGGGKSRGTEFGGTAYTSPTTLAMCYIEDKASRDEYLYMCKSTYFSRINIRTGITSNTASFIWPTRDGNNNTSYGPWMAWDGNDHIYMIRGGAIFNGRSADWAMYTISSNTWRATTNPEDANFRNLPHDTTSSAIVFAHKSITGLQYNRLYTFLRERLYWINLDDDSGLPLSNWTLAGYSGRYGISDTYDYNRLMITRHGKILVLYNQQSDIISKMYRVPGYCDRMVESFIFAESGTQTATPIDNSYFPWKQYIGTQFYIDGYMSRVRTAVGGTTQYHFIADEDRVIIATNSNSIWSLAYVGVFNSFYDSEPCAELSQDVKKGKSVVLPLKNIRGTLKEGEYYVIIGNGAGKTETNFVDGTRNKYVNSQRLYISHVYANKVVASLYEDYPAGSKIAYDPQPVGVLFPTLNKFQTTNNMKNANYAFDNSLSEDRAAQTYNLFNGDAIVAGSIQNKGSADVTLDSVKFGTVFLEGQMEGYEVRGELIGVYAVPTTFIDGNVISVGDKSYLIVGVTDTGFKYAVGPIN